MELRPYQLEDLEKLNKYKGTGCFNEQRTGKTPTCITAMDSRGCKKILIICPASIIYQWVDEFEKWTGRPCIALVGTKAKRLKLLDQWTDGAVVNYEALITRKKKIGKKLYQEVPGLAQDILKHKPDGVILDEAHRIKGRKIPTAKAVNKFIGVDNKIALTATPAPSHNADIWPILHWLQPKLFSSYWQWLNENFVMNKDFYNKYGKPSTFLPGREAATQNLIDSFCTMRKRNEVMPWLPEMATPTRIRLPTTPAQSKYIENLMNIYETNHIITEGVLDRIIRIRQICNAPELLGLKGKSPKIEWLQQYIKDYPDVPTVIFSKFSEFLKLIEIKTKGKVHIITGSTPIQERQDLINNFQNGSIKLLAIQIDAGKEGLTLDTGEKIIFMDQTPPASDISQAQDRIIATTPDKADVPKEIINVMMRDTYDEELYNLVVQRQDETEVINDYIKYVKRRYHNGKH